MTNRKRYKSSVEDCPNHSTKYFKEEFKPTCGYCSNTKGSFDIMGRPIVLCSASRSQYHNDKIYKNQPACTFFEKQEFIDG